MTPSHPTVLFTSLAIMLGVGAWALNPLEAQLVSYADEFSFLSIPNGKNVLSGILFMFVGVYGLTRRPRFDLGRDVLVSMALACISLMAMGGAISWYHFAPTLLTRLIAHLVMSLAIMNTAFALVSAQLPLKGHWWLLISCQAVAVATPMYEYWYSDKRYLLMSEVFLVLLVLFSLIRVRSVHYSRYLSRSLIALCLSPLCDYWDQSISKASSYLISGHTLQHLLWSLSALLLLRFLIVIKPSELNAPLTVTS